MSTIFSNIVGKEKMREVQSETLSIIKNALIQCFGPYASNTIIADPNKITQYTKDGFTIVHSLKFNDIIEESVRRDLVEITRYIVKTVGDGTTAATILAEIIFNKLRNLEDGSLTPYEIIEGFKLAVKDVKEEIKSNATPFNSEKAYEIGLISTNGNKKVAKDLKDIYDKKGNDVYIDVSVSLNTESYLKEYDGMTLNTGFSQDCFINNTKGTASIRNAHIYVFEDPIDTLEMNGLFGCIIQNNIMLPMQKRTKITPTVIIAPRISRDAGAVMESIASLMLSVKDPTMRPPLLVVSNIYQKEQLLDICKLTGSKPIRKYIDPKIQEQDVKKGLAPTLKTVTKFAGQADVVESDLSTTKFINPKYMYNKDGSPTPEYTQLYNFLTSAIENAKKGNESSNTVGNLKRRLHSLKANMVEYFIGGLTASDRDALKDLVEDAVLNCRSASTNGVGYGASFEGFRASKAVYDRNKFSQNPIYKIIYEAYEELEETLYNTAKIDGKEIAQHSLDEQCPYNLKTKQYDGKVLSSIESDIVILDSIAKIITLMFTSNQFFCPTPIANKYDVARPENN